MHFIHIIFEDNHFQISTTVCRPLRSVFPYAFHALKNLNVVLINRRVPRVVKPNLFVGNDKLAA